ncbi:MAG TPA: GGDEF domain-containing protein [Solirubrobacteraceae bacterium]|nr:GGDEF domain-containing protein [Solirubrobacteraceae bacterium]
MSPLPEPDPADAVSPLEALLELPRSAGEDTLEDFLVTVADTVCRSAGFASVVINLYRPAWDDYEAVLVIGDGVEELIGTTTARTHFRRILAEAEQPLPGVFFLTEESGFWDDLPEVYVPEIAPVEDPDAWRAGDGLLVFLSDPSGGPLALFSMDEPLSGRRPGDEELRLISAICAHAESAITVAQRTETAAEHARVLSLLLETFPALGTTTSVPELLGLAARTIVPGLGFERVAGYALDGPELVLGATAGWEGELPLPERIPVSVLEPLIDPAHEQAGCFLGSAGELFGDRGEERSRRNGRGSTAWADHCLLVPCRSAEGVLRGLIVVEDPVDRLLPTADRRRAVRLLVDQVAAGLRALENRARLDHLASHDPLTGVRNRRGLDAILGAHEEVALLVCDLDHFRSVNDRFGHECGDQVLSRFGALLREHARETDVAIRLGGEEFCLVLPATDAEGAVQAAERLRAATATRLAEIVPGGLTVSIGVAASDHGVLDARGLLAAADRGLDAAKAAGRDRSVLIALPPLEDPSDR